MKLDILKKTIDNLGKYENLIPQGKKLIRQIKNKDIKSSAMTAVSLGKTLLEQSQNNNKAETSGEEIIENCIEEGVPVEIIPEEIAEKKVVLSENMTQEEENRFIERQQFNLMNASDVTSALSTLNQEVCETIKFCEVQQTKREKIKADASIKIAQINAMTASIKNYLDRSFDERSKIFNNYFNVLDAAIEKGDMSLMASTLQSINNLAASSPFKDLNDLDKVTQNLSIGCEWDI